MSMRTNERAAGNLLFTDQFHGLVESLTLNRAQNISLPNQSPGSLLLVLRLTSSWPDYLLLGLQGCALLLHTVTLRDWIHSWDRLVKLNGLAQFANISQHKNSLYDGQLARPALVMNPYKLVIQLLFLSGILSHRLWSIDNMNLVLDQSVLLVLFFSIMFELRCFGFPFFRPKGFVRYQIFVFCIHLCPLHFLRRQ